MAFPFSFSLLKWLSLNQERGLSDTRIIFGQTKKQTAEGTKVNSQKNWGPDFLNETDKGAPWNSLNTLTSHGRFVPTVINELNDN